MANTDDNTAAPGMKSAAFAAILANPAGLSAAARRAATALNAAAAALDAEALKPAEIRTTLAAAFTAFADVMRKNPLATSAEPTSQRVRNARRSPDGDEIERAPDSDFDRLGEIRLLIRDLGVLWSRDTLTRHGVTEYRQLNSAQLAAVRIEAEHELALRKESEPD